jgi:hypothetical protein
MIIFYIPFILAIFGMLGGVFMPPQAPMSESSVSTIAVVDDCDVFTPEEESDLYNALQDLKNETGLVTQVVTVSWEQWSTTSASFPSFALSQYSNYFADERGWLIMYSEKDGGQTDWEWEGIQGDYTWAVMDVFIDDFNRTVNGKLQNSGPNPAKALITAINNASNDFAGQSLRINWEEAPIVLFVMLFITFHASMMIFAGTNTKYSNKELEEVDNNGTPISQMPTSNDEKPTSTVLDFGGIRVVTKDTVLKTLAEDHEQNKQMNGSLNSNGVKTYYSFQPKTQSADAYQKPVEKAVTPEVVNTDSHHDSEAYGPDPFAQKTAAFETYTPKPSAFDVHANDHSTDHKDDSHSDDLYADVFGSSLCHYCGKVYTKLENGRCPHCKALLSYK